MKRVLLRLVNRLRPSQPSRALGVITCAASANALIAFEQQLNHLVTGAISDCVGAQILQFVPLLAAMSTGGSNSGSIAAQIGCGSCRRRTVCDVSSPRFMRPKSGGEKRSRVAELKLKEDCHADEWSNGAGGTSDPGASLSDDELETRVRSLLRWKIRFNAVHVAVESGHVTLSGQVISALDRETAEQTIRRLRGVVGVTNCIIASPTTGRALC